MLSGFVKNEEYLASVTYQDEGYLLLCFKRMFRSVIWEFYLSITLSNSTKDPKKKKKQKGKRVFLTETSEPAWELEVLKLWPEISFN